MKNSKKNTLFGKKLTEKAKIPEGLFIRVGTVVYSLEQKQIKENWYLGFTVPKKTLTLEHYSLFNNFLSELEVYQNIPTETDELEFIDYDE